MLHVEARARARGPGGCARAAPVLLAHLSLLFVLYGGALLATSARLKWDPSTYVALRALLPTEYRVLCALAPLAGLALLACAHLALAAALAKHARTRAMLYLILAISTSIAVVLEVGVGAWAGVRVREFLDSDVARQLRETLEVREHLLQLLAALERWHPLPSQIKELLQEAEADLPWDGYVSAAAAAVLLAAQLAAIALALLARTAANHDHAHAQHTNNLYKVTRSRSAANGHDRALLEPGFR